MQIFRSIMQIFWAVNVDPSLEPENTFETDRQCYFKKKFLIRSALELVGHFKNRMKYLWGLCFVLSVAAFTFQAVILTETFLAYNKATVLQVNLV